MNLTQLEMMETELKRKRYYQNKVQGLSVKKQGFQGLNCKKPGVLS
jgi:hypothetical protein